MSSGGNMLDSYLIAQALGWEWNFWTMITITGIEIGLFLLFIIIFGLIAVWADMV